MSPSRTGMLAAASLLLASSASAATVVSGQQMTDWLNAGGADLAYAYAPAWFFGQSENQVPAYPTWAFSGSPDSPDIYDAAHQTAPAPQCDYPDVGCNARNPGVGIGNPGPAFPVYYSYTQCNATEIRVAYNLFYQKDGAQFGAIATGHDWDWERVIVVHGLTDDGQGWQPVQALLSAHQGYHRHAWGDVQNTLTSDEALSSDLRSPNGVQGNDHPKVYVAWSKHAHFDDRNTGFNDPASQSTDNAFRSQDWWHFVSQGNYIRSDRSTAAGQALGSVDWGHASSNPPSVHDSLCSQ